MILRSTLYNGLEKLPASYIDLLQEAGRSNLFLSYAWFRNFQQAVLGGHESIQVLGVEDDGKPLGALLLRSPVKAQGLFAPRMVEGASNYYSCYFGPVLGCDNARVDQVATAWAEQLWARRRCWDVINLRPLDQDIPVFNALARSFRQMGLGVQTYFCFGNWYLAVNGRSYDQYTNSLPTILKETIRRKGKKLQQAGGRLEVITGHAGLESAVAAYTKVYNSSWKTPEPYPDFIPGLIRLSADNGWLRLGLVYLNDEPIAAQLWLVNGGVASIYKLAYDERFANLSAGTILTSALMRHAIDIDKVGEVDYLSGDDEYKKSWMSHRRERWGLMAFNLHSVKGLVQAVRHVGGRTLKAYARKAAHAMDGTVFSRTMPVR